ncbi:ketimine reductase mu-crystallin-like [Macrosteles quadrilineatus]|uniref:ketimine reductase mu-crystallin-like n=1 Tax=Macrosteles quadrilineatus TaxID=74068 RepID=UPI0023E2FEB6|nr:ketimine reductase mu-crystallin-like [Macrosteles quadrilineatus]
MGDTDQPVYLNESNVLKYLSWDDLIPTIENVLSDISHKDETETIQPARLIMPIPPREGALLCMPSFSGKLNTLGCKVVSSFRKNAEKGLPSIFGTVLLLDAETGKVKMIMEGGEITGWRTAAASVVSTKHLHRGQKNVLAILGAGVQGRIHALAMQHYFKFSEVRVWNRTYERAEKLCNELGPWAKPYKSNEDCVRGADVIVTATYAKEPIIHEGDLQIGAHINAVGFGVNHHCEVSRDVYNLSAVVVDNMPGALHELRELTSSGVKLQCEVGEVIRKVTSLPDTRFTVFHSMGMSLEDVAVAQLVYSKYMEENGK